MFKNIVVALDGSPHSRLALPTAIEIARQSDATIFVVHVVEHDRGRAVAYSTEGPAQATRLVFDAVEQIRGAGVRAEGQLLDRAAGHVAIAIAETAAAHEADLVVMGSRRLSDAQAIFVGSVTHGVLQLVEAPVLIAPPPKAGAKAKRPSAAVATS